MKRAKGRIIRKRALSMLVALTMLFSSIELTAFATEQDPSSGMDTFTEETVTPEDSETTDETGQNENREETDGIIDSDQTDDSDESTGEEDSDKADDSDETQSPDGEDESGDSDETQDSDDEEKADDSDEIADQEEENESDKTEDKGNDEDNSEEEEVDESENIGRASVTVDNSNMSINASNALGSLFLDEIQAAAQEEQEEIKQSFVISDIEVTDKTAVVKIIAAEYCTVAVGIYEDKSEKPLAYGYAPVEIGTSRVSVEIGIDEMPAYFIVKAYIVDTDSLRPLSKEYTSTKYTQAMQEFLKKTTENFAPDKVVNLDEDIKTNFLVVKDDNFLIRAESGEEESITNELINYDEDTNTYTFSNVDENIKDLKDGDIFVYQYGENDFLVIKVKEISHRQIGEEEERETEEKEETEETEKTEKTREVYDIIAYEDELNVDDVFRYVKIEESMGTADMDEIDPNTVSCPEGVTYLGRDLTATYAIEGDVSQNISLDNWNLDLKKGIQGSHGPLEGTLDGEVGVSFGLEIALTYYFDVDVWAGFDCIWAVDFSITSELSATGQIDAEGKFSIPLFSTPQLKEGSILTIEYLPEFVIDMSFHGEINIGAAATFGVSFGDQENSSLAPDVEVTLIEVSAEVNGYIGVDFNPKLSVDGVFSAELESGVHLGVKASASVGISGSSDEETERHDCGAQCISGEVYLDVPFDGRLEVLKLREFDLGDRLNIEGSLIYITFTEFYYSIKHHDFGWGICPHKEYKTTVVVKTDAKSDIPNIPIEGAKVTVNGMNGTTDKNGMCIFWLPGGKHAFNAEYQGNKTGKTVTIDGGMKVELLLNVNIKVEKFVSGGSNSAAIMSDGSLFMWGGNGYGQIGNGGTNKQDIPYRVMGDVKETESNFAEGITNRTSYAITKDGILYMWGDNLYGQIGKESIGGIQNTPYPVLDNVTEAGINIYTSYAITTDGTLYVWGRNNYGQVGNDNQNSVSTPCPVLDNVKEAGGDGDTSYAITTDGILYMWGRNNGGQVGNSDSGTVQQTPVEVMDDVLAAGISDGASYAITTDGTLYMWGSNYGGRIGNKSIGGNQKTPYKVLDNVKEARTNNYTSYAITKDGNLYIWGSNAYGQIGNGNTENTDTPYLVKNNVVKAGSDNSGESSYAITTDGSLYTWGRNKYGQLGNGNTDDSSTPTSVMDNVSEAGMDDFLVTATTHVTSYAITTDGSLYMWGDNIYAQAGNENIGDVQNVPNKIMDNVSKAGTRGGTSYAITKVGILYMWGSNSSGEIGNGTYGTIPVSSPYKVQFSGATAASYTTQSINDVELAVSNTDEPIAVSLSAVHDADTIADNTATFSNLTPNDIYNIYVMQSKDAEEPLGSDNLLYIAQAVSDTSGNLSVAYGMTQDYNNPVVFCVGFTQTDLSSAEVTVSDITYDGDAHYPEATVILGGQLLTEGTDYEIYGDCSVTDIGEYKILIKGIGTYCGEKEATFHVKAGSGDDNPGGGDNPDEDTERDDVLPDDIPADGIPEGLWIAGVDENGYPYTGSTIKPEVRVYDHKTLLIEKIDYTITYKNNTKANDASVAGKAPTITVTGKGNYTGKETQTFKILPLDISPVDISQEGADKSDVFEADDISVVYNGKAQKPSPALYWNGKKLTNKTDYTFTYHEGTYTGTDTEQTASVKETGDYYIKLTGKGNFTGIRRMKLTVLPKATEDSSVKPISKATVPKIPNQSYLALGKNGAVAPEVTVKYGSQTLEPGTHYTVAYSNNTKVGTAYAIITGIEKNGYSGTKRVSFKITGMAISKAKVNGLSSQTFLYTGADIEPALTLTVKLNGTDVTLVKDTDYSVTWQKNQNAGTAAVTFTGKNGYTGTLKKTFKIKAFNIAENKDSLFQAELKSDTVPYAKGGAKPELTVTFQVNDGTPDGTQQTLTLKEGTDYTVSYKNNKAVNGGSNPAKLPMVTIKGKGNFTGTYSQNLTYTITAQDLGELKLTAADKVYQNKKNIYTTKVTITDLDGKVLKAGTDYEKKLTYTYKNDTTLDNGTIRQAGEAVDKNDIIPTDTEICVTAASKGSSYTGTLSGEYSFKECDISGAKVTIPRQTYTGRKITLDKTDEKQILVKVKGKKVEPDQFDIVGYTNNVKKGTATVTIKGKGNYGGTKTVKFTIKAKGFLWWWKN